ncbi:hypothetical protein X772_27245 [Mesorhizobium sp. LSJC280B00]|nr:hypothetical protein X772_27245 [Mesorhizobium sp. LSJC280B00]
MQKPNCQTANEPSFASPESEETEVNHFVETQSVSPAQARELVRRHGNDWRKIDDAAKSYKDDS